MNFYHKEKYLDPSKNLFQKILIVNAKKIPDKSSLFRKITVFHKTRRQNALSQQTP